MLHGSLQRLYSSHLCPIHPGLPCVMQLRVCTGAQGQSEQGSQAHRDESAQQQKPHHPPGICAEVV